MPLNFVNRILDFELNLDIHREKALKEVFSHFEASFKQFLKAQKTPTPPVYLIAFADGKHITKHYDGTDFYFPSSPLLFFGSGKNSDKLIKVACIRAFTHINTMKNLSVTSTLNDWYKKSENEKLIKSIGLVHVNDKKVTFRKDDKLKTEVNVTNKKILPAFRKLVDSICKTNLSQLLDGSVDLQIDYALTEEAINAIGIEITDTKSYFKFLASLLYAYAKVSDFKHIYYLPSIKLKENSQLESLGFMVVSSKDSLSYDHTALLKAAGGVLLSHIGLIESNFRTKKEKHRPHIKRLEYNPGYLNEIVGLLDGNELDKEIITRYFEYEVVKAMAHLKRQSNGNDEASINDLYKKCFKCFDSLTEKVNEEVKSNLSMKSELIRVYKLLQSQPKGENYPRLGHPNQFIINESDWSYYNQFTSFEDISTKGIDRAYYNKLGKPLLDGIKKKDKDALGRAISSFESEICNLTIDSNRPFISFTNNDKPIVLFTKEDWDLIKGIIKENFVKSAGGNSNNFDLAIRPEDSRKEITFVMQTNPIEEQTKLKIATSLNNKELVANKLSHLKFLICEKYKCGLNFLNVNDEANILSVDKITDEAKWIVTKDYSCYTTGFYYILKF